MMPGPNPSADRERPSRSDPAASPVVDVTLLVAITVVLAAVLGVFVLTLAADLEQTPHASITITGIDHVVGADDEVTIRHQGGDVLVAGDVTVVVIGDGEELVRGSLTDVSSGGPNASEVFEPKQTVTIDTAPDGEIEIEPNQLVEVLLVHSSSGDPIARAQRHA